MPLIYLYMKSNYFIAFDLGATSGRTIAGTLNDGMLEIRELTRFPNKIMRVGDHYYWNLFSLFESVKDGLAAAAKEGMPVTSAGVDTWGVDCVFIGQDGSVLGLPFSYRDPHTIDACRRYTESVFSKENIYARTGIQIMNFNTLFQLYALRQSRASSLQSARHILFMPDAFTYLLTGVRVTEYTIASTSQLFNMVNRTMDSDLLNTVGVSQDMFGNVVYPGTYAGLLRQEIAEEVGLPPVPVVTVAGHDTASAVAAVPAKDCHFAFLSSGTWSLMGIEVDKPIVNEHTYSLNLTNEGGVDGTVRLLKNITGMWLLEQCLEIWKREGYCYTYGQIEDMVRRTEPLVRFVDPDDMCFANQTNMPSAIMGYCERTRQPLPVTHAEYVRLIFDSLALKYREVLGQLRSLAPFSIDVLHVIGGGSKNRSFSQMTADAVGIPVIAGPSEAASVGNIMLQARAAGLVSSLQDMRRVVAASVDTEIFMPQDTAVWDHAYQRFLQIKS